MDARNNICGGEQAGAAAPQHVHIILTPLQLLISSSN